MVAIGLPSKNTPVRKLIDNLSAIDGLQSIPKAFHQLSDSEANNVITQESKLKVFLSSAIGNTNSIRQIIEVHNQSIVTDLTIQIQSQPDQAAQAAAKTEKDIKDATAIKNASIAIIGLFDKNLASDVDKFATPTLNGTTAIMDLASNGFSAAATGNVVVAAVSLVRVLGNFPDAAAVEHQQVMNALAALSSQLKAISQKLEVIDGKLNTVISKIDDLVSIQHADTNLVLQELEKIEDQIARSQTLIWQTEQDILAQDHDTHMQGCRKNFSNYISNAVNDADSAAAFEYNNCVGDFLSLARTESKYPGNLGNSIDFNADNLLNVIRRNPEDAVALLPYFVTLTNASASVLNFNVAPDPGVKPLPFNPEVWADEVWRVLLMKYWVPQAKDDGSDIFDLKNDVNVFKTSFQTVLECPQEPPPFVTSCLAKRAVMRYIVQIGILNQFLMSEVQPVFRESVSSKIDLLGGTRPTIFSPIDIFTPPGNLGNAVLGNLIQLGIASEVVTVRGDGEFRIVYPHHAPGRYNFFGCLVMDISAADGPVQIGPKSVRFCEDQRIQLCHYVGPGHFECLHGFTLGSPDMLTLGSMWGKTGVDTIAQIQSRWPDLVRIFRSAPDWPSWEAQLPSSYGFSSAAAILAEGGKIQLALDKLKSDMYKYIVVLQNSLPHGTSAEVSVANKFKSFIEEINRSYVTAVSLLVLTYGECLGYSGFDDWPKTGPYGLMSGDEIKSRLASGESPIIPELDAAHFPVFFANQPGGAQCRGFPAGLTKGMDWLAAYDLLH